MIQNQIYTIYSADNLLKVELKLKITSTLPVLMDELTASDFQSKPFLIKRIEKYYIEF